VDQEEVEVVLTALQVLVQVRIRVLGRVLKDGVFKVVHLIQEVVYQMYLTGPGDGGV
jgi:hypothetical protein